MRDLHRCCWQSSRANGSGSRNRKQIHHSGNDIFDADACGVDEDSIVCRLQGRHGTLSITAKDLYLGHSLITRL